jgi:hypothetical protein
VKPPTGVVAGTSTTGLTTLEKAIGLLPPPPKSPGNVVVPAGFSKGSRLPIHVPESGIDAVVVWE